MRGQVALVAKIVAGFDQALPKILLPDPVHRYAGKQGVILPHKPLCQSQPVAGLFGIKRGQKMGRFGLHFIAGSIVGSPPEQMRGFGMATFAHYHHFLTGIVGLGFLLPKAGNFLPVSRTDGIYC